MPTIEELQAEISSLKSELTTKNESLEQAKNGATELSELSLKVEVLGNEVAEKNERLEEAEKTIEQLKSMQPKKAVNKDVPTKTFKVGQKSFRFNVKAFFFNSKKIFAEDALKDKELLKELIKEKVGVIEAA